jgi:hypothetical protein
MSQTAENSPPGLNAPDAPPIPAAARTTSQVTVRPSRRTRVMIRSISPLSVLKFSLLFYFCVWLIVFLALVIIYALLNAVGAVDSLEKLLGYLFAPTGQDISTRGATPIEINEGVAFTYLFIGGCVLTVAWALINVLAAFLYNLISDVIGGIEVTLAERRAK